MNPHREETLALYEMLEDGEWHDGLGVLREMQRVIPPGVASREGQKRVKDPSAHSLEELVRIGRRNRSRETINSLLRTGRLEVDVERPLSKDNWSGAVPFKIRDVEAGLVSVGDLADELNIGDHILRTWVKNEYVPHTTNKGGTIRFSQEQADIVRRVYAIWPGPGAIRWPQDPRTLWAVKEAGVTVVCPHCDQKLTVTLGTTD